MPGWVPRPLRCRCGRYSIQRGVRSVDHRTPWAEGWQPPGHRIRLSPHHLHTPVHLSPPGAACLGWLAEGGFSLEAVRVREELKRERSHQGEGTPIRRPRGCSSNPSQRWESSQGEAVSARRCPCRWYRHVYLRPELLFTLLVYEPESCTVGSIPYTLTAICCTVCKQIDTNFSLPGVYGYRIL